LVDVLRYENGASNFNAIRAASGIKSRRKALYVKHDSDIKSILNDNTIETTHERLLKICEHISYKTKSN
jgi:hypothetical protein